MKLPDVIRIEPSSACNLKCIHCPTGTTEGMRGIMRGETFTKILSQLPVVPRVVALYHGGEPTLCKSLWEWVKQLKDMGVQKIKVVSNGMLLDAEKVAKSGLDFLSVSIDGRSPEENNTIRRGADCQRVISNVKKLLSIKPDNLEVTINNVQFHEPILPAFLTEAFGNKVKYFSYKAIAWAGTNTYTPPQRIKEKCSLLDETITIRWNGEVVPCCYDITSQCVLGNVYVSSLQEIWDGERYERVREGIKEGNPIKMCEPCCRE